MWYYAVTAGGTGLHVFYGISDSRVRFAGIEDARKVVGYPPQDRAEDHADN